MKLRLNVKENKKSFSGYKIPESVCIFLNEKYSTDISTEIIKYFIVFLNENKFYDLNWYLKDINEIKVSLNLLENRKIQFDQQKNDQIVNLFSHFIESKFDNIQIITEYYDEFQNISTNKDSYELIFEKFILLAKKIEEEEKKEKEQNSLIEIKLKKKKKKNKYLKHEWNGTLIRFETAPGKWGKWVDLKGKDGANPDSRGRGGGIGKSRVQQLIKEAVNSGFPTDYTETIIDGITYIEYKDFIDG